MWSIDPQVNQRNRKAKLTQQDVEAIEALVQKRPDITTREIKEILHLNVCAETIRKAVVKLGYRVKRRISILHNRSAPDVKTKRISGKNSKRSFRLTALSFWMRAGSMPWAENGWLTHSPLRV